MFKKIVSLLLMLSILFIFSCSNKEALPIKEQKEKLNNNVVEMLEEPRFAHVKKYIKEDEEAKDNSYVQLLSNVGVDLSKVLKEMSIRDFNGDKVKNITDSKKRKVIIMSWCYCGACMSEMKQELLNNYNEEDFDLGIIQYELVDKTDLTDEQKKQAVDFEKQTIKKAYEEEGVDKFLDYSIYGATMEFMDNMGLKSFPSILYLDENNKIVNVSGYINYEGMKELLCK